MADTQGDGSQADRIDAGGSAEEGVGREDRIYEKRFSAAEDRTRKNAFRGMGRRGQGDLRGGSRLRLAHGRCLARVLSGSGSVRFRKTIVSGPGFHPLRYE